MVEAQTVLLVLVVFFLEPLLVLVAFFFELLVVPVLFFFFSVDILPVLLCFVPFVMFPVGYSEVASVVLVYVCE